MYYPADRSEVTESWLVDTLADKSPFDTDPIDKISLQYLGDGMGQLSTLVLADITHASGRAEQIVVKLHANVPGMHEVGVKYGHYESEVNFYNHMKDHVPVRTPEIHVSAYDKDNQRVVVIMESFADWHSPDQVDGATAEEVGRAVEELAKITAAYWNKPLMDDFPWFRNMQSLAFETFQEDYLQNIPESLARMAGRVPGSTAETVNTIGPRIDDIRRKCCEGNQALSHWDYRVENFFYKDDEFAVIDWQLMMRTTPATDIAYLLSSNIDTSLRRAIEHDLIERYLEKLKEHGVKNYSRQAFDDDLRLALLCVSGIPVISMANIDETNDRSMALGYAISQRMFQTIEDWDALSVLD